MIAVDRTYQSPNHSSRNGRAIGMIVVHATAGKKAGDIQTLTNDKVPLKKRVSCHYYITKDGTIYQLVDDSDAAWHAGASSWMGLDSEDIQLISIGIELENLNDGVDPYPDVQYRALVALTRDLVNRHRIPGEMLVRHVDIAPKRKTDPRGFPWQRFKQDVYMPAAKPLAAEPLTDIERGIDPAFLVAWRLSGGEWRPNELTPGRPLDIAYTSNGQKVQRFQRGIAKLRPDGGVDWALVSEFDGLRKDGA